MTPQRYSLTYVFKNRQYANSEKKYLITKECKQRQKIRKCMIYLENDQEASVIGGDIMENMS